jgi:quercetin dioxygenase-like cupin family protein
MTYVPLTRQMGGLRAYKQILPGSKRPDGEVTQGVHEGYEWLYVLSGRLRLLLGEHDILLKPGEVAEFDTHVPHAFATGAEPAEVLCLFGPQGERMHVRAAPAGR